MNLNNLLDELFTEINEIKKQKNLDYLEIQLKKEITNQDLYILSDAKRISQIFNNLLDNALKFTEKGNVEFGYTITGNNLNCFVTDTGIGIHEKDLRIIFDRFRQVDESTTRKYGGTGTGLALCKSLVELLGGNISVKSEPGKGTSFQFTIPFNQISTEKEKPSGWDNLTTNWINKKILIAEDEPTNFQLLETILSRTKAEVHWVQNGQDVISILEKISDFDIVIMDINMPKMNGNDALTLMKQKGIKIPVIAHTAYATDDKIKEILEIGYNDYILKPIQIETLFKILTKFLD